MRTPHHTLLHTGLAHGTTALSPEQKKFHAHMQRITAQRALWAAWQEAVVTYRARHTTQWRPQHARYQAQASALAHWLDAAVGHQGLSKADRTTLSDIVARMACSLLQHATDTAARHTFQALYNRHCRTDGDGDAVRPARSPHSEHPDPHRLDPQAQATEDVLHQAEAQRHAAQSQAEQARAAYHAARRKKKPTARERQEQEAAQHTSQSVRAVYRKLASALHPDRESDATERLRKTALMQRANQAYAAQHLLDLLQLQLETEHLDPTHLAGLDDERLRHYNRALQAQQAELEQDIRAMQQSFCLEFGLDPSRPYQPAYLLAELRLQIQHLQQAEQHLLLELRTLRSNPTELKRWLQRERTVLRKMERMHSKK